jgi:hypothetical protein
MIYVSDSMDNGVKSARNNIEFRYNNSEFLQEWIPHATFTDNFAFASRRGVLRLHERCNEHGRGHCRPTRRSPSKPIHG